MAETPCYYCDGTGRREWVHGDDSGICVCSECAGSRIACRRAGDRYTGPKILTYSFGGARTGDPLEIMARQRTWMLAARRADDWQTPSLEREYAHFRGIAMRKTFATWVQLRRMLDLADACVERAARISAEVARRAA